MTMPSYTLTDSATMVQRNLLHALRYPAMTLSILAIPVIFLLLFVYVLGGTLGAGMPGPGGDAAYIDYLAPCILIMAAAAGAGSTAVAVSVDMTEGIVNRFRTMAIARASVLTGHVVGRVIQTLISVALVIGVALLIGFRPSAGVAGWVTAIGLLTLLTFALTWLSVGIGLVTKGPEAASNVAMPLQLLPFVGSAFVPTDSMASNSVSYADVLNRPFVGLSHTSALHEHLAGHALPLGSQPPYRVRLPSIDAVCHTVAAGSESRSCPDTPSTHGSPTKASPRSFSTSHGPTATSPCASPPRASSQPPRVPCGTTCANELWPANGVS